MPIVMNVVGARPQFIKAGPVSKALDSAGIEEILVHTGQHYDDLLSEKIMHDVGLREPDINLGAGSGSHAVQTARILERVEDALLTTKTDAVLIYGDTNSTVAAALAATKLGIFTAHVEAGLRSFNRKMPEELNRVATDHLSDLLLAPTETAMGHLNNEGLANRAIQTGDVMIDALELIDFDQVRLPTWARGDFYCATIHRAENTDDTDRMSGILKSLSNMNHKVHLLAHPRLRHRLSEVDPDHDGDTFVIHDPLPYAQMVATVRASRGLLTDSGGLQKEAFILRTPCITLRGETEWPETLEGGWNVLAEPGDSLIALASRTPTYTDRHPFGDGTAATSVVREVTKRL